MNAPPAIVERRGGGSPGQLPALTGLRGLAAVTVVLFHLGVLAGGALPQIWDRGYLAVDLFFFLSGFVLTHVYGGRFTKRCSRQTFARFLWARFSRVYPASLFATLISILLFTASGLPFPAGAFSQVTANLTLMQIPWLETVVLNDPAWSISAELYAYLLFPILAPIIIRLSGRVAAMLGTVLVIGVALDHMVFSPSQEATGWIALVRALSEFTVGIFAYRSYSERLFRNIWEKDVSAVVVIALIIGACFTGVSDGPIVILLLALLLVSVCNSGIILRLLSVSPLIWLGEISYSLYIFQKIPLVLAVLLSGWLAMHGYGGAWLSPVAILLTLGCGALVHRYVDVPARAGLRLLPDRVTAFAAGSRSASTPPLPPVSTAAPKRTP